MFMSCCYAEIIRSVHCFIQTKQASTLFDREAEISRLNEEMASLKHYSDLADQAHADARRKLLDCQHIMKDLEVSFGAILLFQSLT